ncbi:MAG: lysophospholipid acyltransferase family protein [Pseudomonas sp.]|nr:lysophospholipid acyltransferase family protein [Pseudomonas sp.]
MNNSYSPPYLWRLIFTALSFALFGLGGLLLRLVVFPLLSLLPASPLRKRQRARAVISGAFRVFVEFMRCTGVLTYSVKGIERLGQPGQMVIANHPSLIDVVVLISCIRDANCVVKESLWKNPFMRGPIRSAGYISNDGSIEMLETAAQLLKEGQTLIIFPEGTRTTPGQSPNFHRGAAAIALRGAKMIAPVRISVTPTTLTKAEPWYSIADQRVHFSLEVGEMIDPCDFNAYGSAPIASRKLNQYLHSYYTKDDVTHE